eukprot:scaffold140773_cov63-Cyclotella_meneghiniana.AAC.2
MSQPSESPSEQPSGMPSNFPTSQPSESPSEQPSGMPSESPSSQPSESSSEQLSGMPSELPSSQPSAAPSIDPFQQAPRIQIVIPSTISLSGFQTPSPEELPTVVSILAANVAAVVSSSLNSSQRVKSVNIISINGVLVTGFSFRRLIVRNLSEATVEYEILLEEICSNDGCSDADTAAQALYKQATDAMREAIDSGAFATAVISDADSANVNALLEIAVASSDFSSVILNLVGLIFSESPSSEPSGTPSCTPSSAPTPLLASISSTLISSHLANVSMMVDSLHGWRLIHRPGFLPLLKDAAHSTPLGISKNVLAAILKSVPQHCGTPIGWELTRDVS